MLARRLSLREVFFRHGEGVTLAPHCVCAVQVNDRSNLKVAIKQEIASPRYPWTCHDRMESMEIGETLYVTTRDEFRQWLEENHNSRKEIWLIQYKKATKKPSINYVEAVEEALCFGWIDNTQKSIDTERYATRFSPRRPKSNWTETNKERARRLIAEGKMTEAGRTTLPADVSQDVS